MTVAAAAAAAAARAQLVKGNKVMIFIKGPPEQPQCGFSMQVVRILNFYGALDWSLFAQRAVKWSVALRFATIICARALRTQASPSRRATSWSTPRFARTSSTTCTGAQLHGWRACAAA